MLCTVLQNGAIHMYYVSLVDIYMDPLLACQTVPSTQVHYIAKLVNPHLSGDPTAANFSTILVVRTRVYTGS